MDIRATELVLRKLIDAMERRCAGFPVRYELELLTIETAKEQLDKIQAELNTPANIQQQVQPDNSPKAITLEHPHASMLFDL